MKTTIGGQRLGSGNKMEVNTKTFERSTHDLGYIWRSTMAAGTLVPFMVEVGLPGDTFDIDLEAFINTHPTIGPLFGSAKVQLDVFQCPVRLYNRALHNNKIKIGMQMNQVKLPQLKLFAKPLDYTKQLDNQHTNPSSLLAYLNMRGFGNIPSTDAGQYRYFNALSFLSYWDIYKNYYANKQEEIGAFINNEIQINKTITTVQANTGDTWAPVTIPEVGGTTPQQFNLATSTQLHFNNTVTPKPTINTLKIRVNGIDYLAEDVFENVTIDTTTATALASPKIEFLGKKLQAWRYLYDNELLSAEPQIKTFPLENIDTMRDNILGHPTTSPYIIDSTTLSPYGDSIVDATPGLYSPLLASQEGLALKTYQSDLLNNWMQTEWLDGTNGINEITAVDTSSGNFKIDALNLAKKVYEMLNQIAISGGTYIDWVEQVYSHTPFRKAETPIYEGGLIKELVFKEVISNSQATGEDGSQPLGTLAGKGKLSGKHKGGKLTIHVDEHSYIIGIVSITPRIDYSQGNKWDINLQTMDDFHKPHLDEIGFQDLITEQAAWWDTTYNPADGGSWQKNSAGKQPAWINYMTNINIVRGNFAIEDNEMFMTFNRRYEHEPTTGRIKDLTTYIDPVKFNNIFAETARDAQNYWVQIGVNMTARRKMSARIMPNL